MVKIICRVCFRPFVPTTKIQAAVKPRPFLHKVAAANPEYEKSLLQVHNIHLNI